MLTSASQAPAARPAANPDSGQVQAGYTRQVHTGQEAVSALKRTVVHQSPLYINQCRYYYLRPCASQRFPRPLRAARHQTAFAMPLLSTYHTVDRRDGIAERPWWPHTRVPVPEADALYCPSARRSGDGREHCEFNVEYSGPESMNDTETAAEAFQHTIELATKAEAWGYHRFWVSEHHGSDRVMGSSPEVLIAHLLAKTTRIRVGAGGVMLQHYSPYKVAENFNVLASLAPGRRIWALAGDQAACRARPRPCSRD